MSVMVVYTLSDAVSVVLLLKNVVLVQAWSLLLCCVFSMDFLPEPPAELDFSLL